MKFLIKNKIIFVIEIAALLIFTGIVLYKGKHREYIPIALSDMHSEHMIYQDNEWIFEANKAELTDDEIELLYGPVVSLKRGTYSLYVSYESETDFEAVPVASGIRYYYLQTNRFILQKWLTDAKYRFEVNVDLEDFEIKFYYTGEESGNITIKNIAIMSNIEGMKRLWVGFVCLLIFANLCIWKWEKLKENKNILIAIWGIALVASLPLFLKGTIIGHDWKYHINRIEALAHEIRIGNIPAYIDSYFFAGNGYASPVYYNDLMLYFPALLRLSGFSVQQAYELYIFAVNLLTTVISYKCFKRIFRNQKETAICVTMAYVTSSYRLVDIYVRAAVGEYSAMTFFPLIALGIYLIYFEEMEALQEKIKSSLILAFGMTGVISTHVLTVEMVVFTLILFAAVFIKNTFEKKRLMALVMAAAETVILSLYFIVPFLDYYINVDTWISYSVKNEPEIFHNVSEGVYIAEYFSFFRDPFTTDSLHRNMRLLVSPGIILMAALVIAIILWINNKINKRMKYLTVLTVLLLYLASNAFPWNYFAATTKIGNILAAVQFPWRFVSIISIFLSMIFGGLLASHPDISIGKKEKDIIHAMTFFICILMSCYFTGQCADDAIIRGAYDTLEISSYEVCTGEYVRYLTGKNVLDRNFSHEGALYFEVLSEKGTEIVLDCVTGDLPVMVTVPRMNYKGYHVVDEDGHEYEIFDNWNNQISFVLSDGFSSKLFVRFKAPLYWHIALWGSLTGLVAGIWLLIRLRLSVKNR